MASSSFASRVVIILSFVVFVIFLGLAAELGAFGPVMQEWLRLKLDPLVSYYLANKEPIDKVLLVVGTLISSVTATLAILRAFYYAERALPWRLQKLAQRTRDDFVHEKSRLLAFATQPFKTEGFLEAPINANPFTHFLAVATGYRTPYYRAREVATWVEEKNADLGTLRIRIDQITHEKITGHLLRAACRKQEAAKLAHIREREVQEKYEAALAEYWAVLTLQANEIDALEGAAEIARLMGRTQDRHDFLCRLELAAHERPLIRARALRQLAQIDAEAATGDLEMARERLVRADRDLAGGLENKNEVASELIEILVAYAQIQMRRERFHAARGALRRSCRLSDKLAPDQRDKAKDRITALRKELAEESDLPPELPCV